jgi:kynureninase
MTDDDAPARDAAEALTPGWRDRFHIPVAPDGSPAIYLAGQSLGLQPRTAAAAVGTELDAWARQGVDAWFDPARPWFTLDTSLRGSMGRVVGALPIEVALLNSLTVNIHLLLASFFRPDGRRRRILADGPLFPSDRHGLTSHLAQRGLDPATDLVVIGPRQGEHLIRTEDIETAIAVHADDLALVFLSGVNFATGQALERSSGSPPRVTRRAPSSAGTWRTPPGTSRWRSTTGMSTSPPGAPTSI